MEMGAKEWIAVTAFALAHLGVLVASIATTRAQVAAIAEELKGWRRETRDEIKDVRRDLVRIGEGLSRLAGKVNGLSSGPK